MYTGKTCEWVGERRTDGRTDVRTTQFAGFLFCFFTFLCYLAVHVKCTVYHFSDCINRATAVLSLCWPTPRHWTYELACTGGTKAAGQKGCRSERLRLVSSDWYCDLNAVRLGRPACRSVQSSKLGHHGITNPFHLFMDMARKYIDLYAYIHRYVCIYTYRNNWWRSWW